jgi:membrane associated rhomboid family serine protease
VRPPDSWKTARVTLVITIATAAAWLVLVAIGLNMAAIAWGGFIPADFAVDFDFPRAPVWLTPLAATFIHANFIHVGFNLLILVFCGRPTEAVLGPVALVILYLAGAYAAAAGHYLVDPADMTPMIGASGAISAVLGAYAMLFGRNKVKIANPTLALWLNALWLLGAWVVLQLIVGLAFAGSDLQIAFAAHIGGFFIGLLLVNPLLLLRYRKA